MAEKILVVDDDMDTLRLVGLMLERQGYTILAATSGQQALTMAKKEKPTLVLLDIMLPDIDGVEVARHLRADPATQSTLIVMFTAKSQVEDKLDGFEAGADAYLVKPIQPRELVANVRAVLQRGGAKVTPAIHEYKDRGEIISVISAKGGVGVTTVALNLGIMLASQSKGSVIVSDFRPGFGVMALELGFKNMTGMNQLLELPVDALTPDIVERELTSHPSGVRFLLASAKPQDARYLSAVENFDALTDSLSYLANYIVLDLGPGLTPVNVKVLERCQHAILVLEPVPQSLVQNRSLLGYLLERGFKEENIILTLVNRLRAGIQLSLGQVQDELGRPVNVVFTAAPELAYQAQTSSQPMILRQSDGVTAQQFAGLTQKVLQLVRK